MMDESQACAAEPRGERGRGELKFSRGLRTHGRSYRLEEMTGAGHHCRSLACNNINNYSTRARWI